MGNERFNKKVQSLFKKPEEICASAGRFLFSRHDSYMHEVNGITEMTSLRDALTWWRLITTLRVMNHFLSMPKFIKIRICAGKAPESINWPPYLCLPLLHMAFSPKLRTLVKVHSWLPSEENV